MTQREVLQKKLRLTLIIAVSVILVLYGIFQARNLALGPMISVTAPVNGTVSSSSIMTISGTARNISLMTLDGGQIFTNENGNFSNDIVLSHGYNVVTLYARDKFGKETTKTLQITYQ